MPGVDQQLFRKVMGRFATGVTVVTTELRGEVFGMTANAFMAGSLVPPLCVISIARAAKMHARLETSGHFGVSLLGEAQQPISQHFSGRGPIGTAPPRFRFIGDVPVLAHAIGAIAADIASTAPCGDHTLFVGRIKAKEADDRQPLVFFGGRYSAVRPGDDVADIAYCFW